MARKRCSSAAAALGAGRQTRPLGRLGEERAEERGQRIRTVSPWGGLACRQVPPPPHRLGGPVCSRRARARSLARSLAPGEVAKQNPPSPAPRPSPTLFPESERRRRRRRRQQEAPPAKFNPHPSLPACQRAHTRRKLHAECKTSSEQDFFALKKKIVIKEALGGGREGGQA